MSFFSNGPWFKKEGATPVTGVSTLHTYFDDTVKGIAQSRTEHCARDKRYDGNPMVVASKLMTLGCDYAFAADSSPTRREEALLAACNDARVSFDLPLSRAVEYRAGDVERIKAQVFKPSF